MADQPILKRTDFDTPDLAPIEIQSPEADDVKSRRRMEAAAIMESDGSGTDFVQAWQRALNDTAQTGQEVRSRATAEALQKVLNENEAILSDLLLEAPEAAEDILAAHDEVKTEVQTKGADLDAPYQVLTKQLQDPFKVDEETRRDLAVRASIADEVHELVAGQSGWEFAGDIALELIPGKFLADVIQTTDTFDPTEWENNIRKMINTFQSLSADEKLRRFPIIKEELLDTLPKFRAAAIMTAMIDPSEEEDVAFEFGPLAIFDAATIAASLLQIANKARKSYNIIKLSEASGNTDQAAKVAATAVVDETGQAADAVGIDKITAANNAMPMVNDIDGAAEPVISGAVQNRVAQFNRVATERLKDLSEGKGFVPESSIPEENLPDEIARIDGQFNDWVQRMVERDKVVLVEKSEPQVASNTVSFDFTVRNAEGTVEKGTFTRQLELDENSYWESLPNPGAFSTFFASKKAQAHGTAFADAVNAAIRLDIADARVQNELGKLMAEAVAPINKLKPGRSKSFDKVGEILQYGDEMVDDAGDGIEFTSAQLRAGVNGIRLADREIEAYHNVRAVVNATADLRNSVLHRSLSQRGVKSIFWDGEGQGLGTALESAEEATAHIARNRLKSVYHPDSKQVMNFDAIEMDRWYAAGHRLVQLEEDILAEGKGLFKHVLVNSKGVQTLPQRVIRTKTGYIPRINPDAAWFVQVLSDTTLDGLPHQTRRAVRGFDNEKDALAFKQSFSQEVADGATDFRSDAQVVMNREGEIEQFSVGASQQGPATSLIYGARKKHERLPFGLPAQELESARLGAFESLGLYMSNTKNFITRNEWRMGMQKKWENTARKLTGNRKIKFTDNELTGNAALDRAKTQIQEWSGFITKEEAMYDDTVQRIYEWVLGRTGREAGLPKRINALKHHDPIALMKSLTFHSLLGALNPAQLIVQASGSAVALSQGMTNIPKHLTRVQAMAAVEHLDRAAHPQTFAKIAKSFGWKPKTLEKHMDLWKESGLFDSTLTSADVEAAAQGFGVTAKAWRKMQNASTFFFRQGELFNRRIAFMQSIDELGGIDAVAGSVQLKREALTRTNDLLLNLGKANRAWWQRGIYSIPTQFLQIQTKTIETFLGLNGSFSTADRMKLAFAQFLLYGSAAVPFGKAMTRAGLDMGGFDQTDVDDEDFKAKAKFLNGGLVDTMIWTVLGADAVLSDRVALLNGFDQTLTSMIEEEYTPWELLGGPTGGVFGRIAAKWDVMSPHFSKYSPEQIEKSVTAGNIDRVLGNILRDTAELGFSGTSSARQVERYIQMNQLNKILDKRGDVIASSEDYNWQTEFAALMGIKPQDLDSKYTLQEMNQNTEEYVEYLTNQLMYNYHRHWLAIGSSYEEGQPVTSVDGEEYELAYQVIMASTDNDNVRKLVRERFSERVKRLARGGSQLARQQDEYYRLFLEDLTDDATALNSKIVQTR